MSGPENVVLVDDAACWSEDALEVFVSFQQVWVAVDEEPAVPSTLAALGSSSENGLTTTEAAARLAREGPNGIAEDTLTRCSSSFESTGACRRG